MRKKEAIARIKINRLLEKSGWRFFDDDNGKANIKLEVNLDNTDVSFKRVPIYIISEHGENIGNIKIRRESNKKGYPIIEEKRDGHLFESAKKDQWVIHSAPIRSLVCPSKFDQPLMNYLTSSSANVKNILFSGHPEKLFKNVCYDEKNL